MQLLKQIMIRYKINWLYDANIRANIYLYQHILAAKIVSYVWSDTMFQS